MKLNERLKLARTQNGYTQQEVADTLHISRATVSSWEVGRTLPSLDFIIDLSNLYNLSLDILLKEDMIMVNQVSKELKIKKIYKRIVIGVGFFLFVFALINAIWLFNVKNQYSYIDENWKIEDNHYLYESGDIYMWSSQLSMKDEFKFHYLNRKPLWIMAFKGYSDENEAITISIRDDAEVFASVPIDKKETTFAFARIDKNGDLIEDKDNPSFIGQSGFGENTLVVHEFLDRNKNDFKQLYTAAEEQFKLNNKISK